MRTLAELLPHPMSRRVALGAASLALAVAAGSLALPSVVRQRVKRAAEERGLAVAVERVAPGLRGVWLRGVRAAPSDEQFSLELDAVRVGFWRGEVEAHGGRLRGRGDPAAVLRRLRGPPSSSSGSGTEARGREITLDGLGLDWEREGQRLRGFGLRATKTDELTLAADRLEVSQPGVQVTIRSAALEVTRAPDESSSALRLQRFSAASVEVIAARGDGGDDLAPPTSGPGPVTPAATVTAEGDARAAGLRRLRDSAARFSREFLTPTAVVSVEAISGRLSRGAETLSFGPSRFNVQRSADQLLLALSPSSLEAGATQLSLDATLSLSTGRSRLRLRGGPISFSTLGVREGQLGIRDVTRAKLRADGALDFSDDLSSFDAHGQVAVEGLAIERRELAPSPIGPFAFELALDAHLGLDGHEWELKDGQLKIEGLRLEVTGQARGKEARRELRGRVRVPLAACQSVISAAPRGLLPLVEGARLQGNFGIDLDLHYGASAPERASARLSVQNDCLVESVPQALSPERFSRPFAREVKAPDGSPMTIETGPGSPNWVAIDDVSRHMETAVLICEDSRFFQHAGFDFEALQNAVEDDMRAGRFVRGASTISMQLAKNLYLGSEKTLGRKLQEALFTLLLEQRLSKRELLELYFNVVELGPGLYGVKDAAQYYFATPARDLSLGQALYLASTLPNPTHSHFGPDGQLSPKWRTYLERLMRIARKIQRVNDSELEAALREPIAFRVPGAGADAGLVLPEDFPPSDSSPPELP